VSGLLRPFDVAAHKTDQPVEFVRDLGHTHVDVIHAFLVDSQTLALFADSFLGERDILGLELLTSACRR
jgi:hypothetical protein